MTVKMASLCYTHSPAFLWDLMDSVDDFKDYMSGVGQSIRHAATEAAMGWVHKKSDHGVSGLYGSSLSLDSNYMEPSRRKSLLDDYRADNVSLTEDDNLSLIDELIKTSASPSKMKFDISLQTPVIMLPRTHNNPEVLVAHLGRISIRNSDPGGDLGGISPVVSTPAHEIPNEGTTTEKIHMEIRDMSMYSINLDKQKSLQEELKMSKYAGMSASTLTSPTEGLVRTSYGTPILHDTVIQLTIQKIEPTSSYINPPDTTMDFEFGGEEFSFKCSNKADTEEQGELNKLVKVKGKMMTPVKLVLSKHVYEQILQTLDNITPPDDEEGDIESTLGSSAGLSTLQATTISMLR